MTDPAKDDATTAVPRQSPTEGAQTASETPLPEDKPATSQTDRTSRAPSPKPVSNRLGLATGIAIIAGIGALGGFLGYQECQLTRADQQRANFVAAARQGALNLTTIDWQRADVDVARIIDSASGRFRDDFAKRAQPFIDAVKQARSTSTGTVSSAGVESESANGAQVLVAVNVKTASAMAAESPARSWRMRISVERVGDQLKVSNVEFVP